MIHHVGATRFNQFPHVSATSHRCWPPVAVAADSGVVANDIRLQPETTWPPWHGLGDAIIWESLA